MQASAQTSKMSGLTRKQVGRSQARTSSRPHRKGPQFRPFSGSNDTRSTRTAAAATETLGKVVGVELIDASTQSYAVTVDIDGKKSVGTVSSAVVNAGDAVSVSVLDAKQGTVSIHSVIPDNTEQDDEAAKTEIASLQAAYAKLQSQLQDAPQPLDVDALTYTSPAPAEGLRDELVALLDLATEDVPFKAGDEVTGVVVSSHVNGVIVDLGEGVKGLLPSADAKVPSGKASAATLPALAVELKAVLAAARSGDEEAIQAAAAPILARKETVLARAEELLEAAAKLRGEAVPEAAESDEALKSALTPEAYAKVTAQLSALEAVDAEDPATVRAALEAVNGELVASEEDDVDVDDEDVAGDDAELDNSAYLDADSSDKLYGYQAIPIADASAVYSAGDEISVYIKDVSSGYVFLSQYSPLEEKHTALADTASFIEDDLPELAEQIATDAYGGALAAGIDLRPSFSEDQYAQAQLAALDKAVAAALPAADKARLDTIKESVLLGGELSFADNAFLASLSPVLGTNQAVRELVGLGGAELEETAAVTGEAEAILADIAELAGEETAESLRAFTSSDLFNVEIDEAADAAEVDRIMSLSSDALQAEIAKVLGGEAPADDGEEEATADDLDILADVKAIEKAAGIDLAAEMAALLGDDANAVLETDLSPLPEEFDFSANLEDADEADLDLGDLGDLSSEDADAIAEDAKKALAAEESATDRKYDVWDEAMDFAAQNDMAVDEAEEDIMELIESNVDDEFAVALSDLDRIASATVYEELKGSEDSTAGSGATVAAARVFAASVGVSAAEVKALRDATGAGMMDCKKALLENGGDAAKATEYLKKKGLLSAGKKAGRVAAEGLIKMYVHPDARFGVLLEVNCETDFVAGNEKFYELVDELCIQLLPDPTIRFVSVDDVSPEVVAKEREIESGKEDLAGKPEAVRAKMIEGRVQKNLKDQSLLESKWWKDDSKTVAQVLKEAITSLGENIKVRRFERITLGEGLAKKEDNLANEVAQATQAQPKPAAPKKEEPKKEEEPKKPAANITVSASQVKALRDATGAGMMDCKRALLENGGDATVATEWLRKKGLASAVKKAGRAAAEGLIVGYIHPDCRFGLVVEVNCETDFVAGNEKFYQFAQSIAVSIASNKEIQYVSAEDIPQSVIELERAAALANPDLEGKPEEIKLKIVEGRVAKAVQDMILMNQPFVYDPEKTVEEVVKEAISTLGENIKIRRFLRYDLGSGIEKKVSDLAAEVAAMTA